MDTIVILRHCFLLIIVCAFSNGQSILSCPSYGCKTSGTFSFALKMPTSNASVLWTTNIFIGPVPNPLGCVGNNLNLICQSNGPGPVGYISLNMTNGALAWRDSLLRFPQLPVLDIDGDLIGSDGHYLVKYEENGKLDAPIRLSDWVFPIFSVTITEDSIIVFPSRNGYVISYYTDGSPHANIPLNGTTGDEFGTFVPITTPVIAGYRAYILTQFNRIQEKQQSKIETSVYRLYAIDVVPRMLDRLHIAWHMDFETQTLENSKNQYRKRNPINVVNFEQEEEDGVQNFKPVNLQTPRIMCTGEIDMVYVSIPKDNLSGKIYGIKDKEGDNNYSITFQRPISSSKMAMYVPDSPEGPINKIIKSRFSIKKRTIFKYKDLSIKKDVTSKNNVLYSVDNNGELITSIDARNGTILRTINISIVLRAHSVITSEIMVAKQNDDSEEEKLIFGVNILNPSNSFREMYNKFHTNATNYMLQLGNSKVDWMVAAPDDLKIVGQIAGIQNNLQGSDNLKDMLVGFAGNASKSKVFAVC